MHVYYEECPNILGVWITFVPLSVGCFSLYVSRFFCQAGKEAGTARLFGRFNSDSTAAFQVPGSDTAPGGSTALLWWRESTLWGKLMSGRWCIAEKQNYNRIVSSSSLHNMKWTLMLQRSGLVWHPHFDRTGFSLPFFSFFFETLHFAILNLTVTTFVMAPWPYALKREIVFWGLFVYCLLWRIFTR